MISVVLILITRSDTQMAKARKTNGERTHSNDAVDDGDRCRHGAVLSHDGLDLARGLHVLRVRHA